MLHNHTGSIAFMYSEKKKDKPLFLTISASRFLWNFADFIFSSYSMFRKKIENFFCKLVMQ